MGFGASTWRKAPRVTKPVTMATMRMMTPVWQVALRRVGGDGVLRADLQLGDPGYEACDDGNTDDEDRCLSSCVVALRRRDRWSG